MRSLLLAIIISILILAQPTPAAFYVAPYGATAGDGSADSPKTLGWAMASAPSGSTIWLIPGTYAGSWVASAPGVTYRSEVGTRARLDGGITISAADVTLRDLEVTDTSWLTRTTATTAQQARYVNVMAQNATLDGLWIHDLGGGIYAFNGSGGATAGLVVRHTLIYNIGWSGHGHGVYTQNDSVGSKLFDANILANQYGFGFHAYGSAGPSAQLQNMSYVGNVQVNNRMLLGGGNTLKAINVQGNRLWRSQLQLGYSGAGGLDVTAEGNWIGQARLQVQSIVSPTVRLNRIAADNDVNVTLVLPQGTGGAWDANSYWRISNGSMANVDGVGFKSFAQWQAYTGWDSTSVYTGTMPSANWIDVQPWGPNKGRVVVYNWTNAPTVTLDLSSLALTPGAVYKLINAQNVAESLSFVAGAAVVLPSSGWTVATPYGASAPLAAWDSRFLVFLVEPL